MLTLDVEANNHDFWQMIKVNIFTAIPLNLSLDIWLI